VVLAVLLSLAGTPVVMVEHKTRTGRTAQRMEAAVVERVTEQEVVRVVQAS
jgi:hypothetical protein